MRRALFEGLRPFFKWLARGVNCRTECPKILLNRLRDQVVADALDLATYRAVQVKEANTASPMCMEGVRAVKTHGLIHGAHHKFPIDAERQ
jgi:hypothetical protein